MKVVLISGKQGSGKDTIAGMLARLFKERKLVNYQHAFADPLKKAVAYMRGEDTGLYYSRNGKDKDDKAIRRKMIVAVGEAANSIEPDIFANFVYDNCKTLDNRNVVHIITDLRKEAEFISILNRKGVKVCVIRLKGSFDPCKDPKIANSPIECELDYLDNVLEDGRLATTVMKDKEIPYNLAVLKPFATNTDQDAINENNRKSNIAMLNIVLTTFGF